jgi:hypothetical protein
MIPPHPHHVTEGGKAMSRALFVLSACLVFTAAFVVADDKDKDKKDDKTKAEKITVEAASLDVARKLDEKKFPFQNARTNVALLVSSAGRQFLGVDQSSKLESLKDDKGNSLVDDKSFFKPNFGTYPAISPDRTAMLVTISSFGKGPGKGASKVVIKGEMVVLCGTGEKTSAETKVEFKEKAEVKFGDLTLKVQQEKGFGTNGAMFQVVGPTAIKSLTVKDGDGKVVEMFGGMPNRFGKDWTATYTLRKEVKEGKVTITYFTKEEQVKVPVDLSVGLDL